MTPKQQLYLDLCSLIYSRTEREDWLLKNDLEAWQLVRQIDDWLVSYRDDPRVSVEQYWRNCQRLIGPYVDQPDEDELVGVSA